MGVRQDHEVDAIARPELVRVRATCVTGGITIGDGTLIGHGSTLTTLNHSIDPDGRADMTQPRS